MIKNGIKIYLLLCICICAVLCGCSADVNNNAVSTKDDPPNITVQYNKPPVEDEEDEYNNNNEKESVNNEQQKNTENTQITEEPKSNEQSETTEQNEAPNTESSTPVPKDQANSEGSKDSSKNSESTDSVAETSDNITSENKASENKTSDKPENWYYNRRHDHIPPTAQNKINLADYGAYYLGDTTQKKVYLTFDCGYENGFTGKILDVLAENDVKAAFFVLRSYITKNTELTKRMYDEGHIVGNHSSTHPRFSETNNEKIKKELVDTENAFAEATGQAMPHYVRPPEGNYSERVLSFLNEQGYKTIFWSFAYVDWIVDEQPGADVAYDKVMGELHDGMILLLHAVSESNTEALDRIIKDLKTQGYSFGSLDDLN